MSQKKGVISFACVDTFSDVVLISIIMVAVSIMHNPRPIPISKNLANVADRLSSLTAGERLGMPHIQIGRDVSNTSTQMRVD